MSMIVLRSHVKPAVQSEDEIHKYSLPRNLALLQKL